MEQGVEGERGATGQIDALCTPRHLLCLCIPKHSKIGFRGIDADGGRTGAVDSRKQLLQFVGTEYVLHLTDEILW